MQISATSLLREVRRFAPQFVENAQHDSCEFLEALLCKVDQEHRGGILDLVRIEFQLKYKCNSCNNEIQVPDRANVLSLPMSNYDSLLDLISAYQRPQETTNTRHCSNCHHSSYFLVAPTISSFPQLLIINLGRFTERGEKISKYIPCPLVLTPGSPHASYNLLGVVNHHGTRAQGHYTAVSKVENSWYHFNDKTVTEVNGEEIISEDTSILFYYC
jgi:ubiquitin C-terminal hydrolase